MAAAVASVAVLALILVAAIVFRFLSLWWYVVANVVELPLVGVRCGSDRGGGKFDN